MKNIKNNEKMKENTETLSMMKENQKINKNREN